FPRTRRQPAARIPAWTFIVAERGMPRMKRTAAPLLIATGCLAGSPLLAAAAAEQELSPVVVSATRLRSVSDLDAPASISTVHLDPSSNLMQTNVTEPPAG